jgi:hypothetical protein
MTIIVSDKKNTPAEKHISYQDESFKERILHQTHVASFFLERWILIEPLETGRNFQRF